MIAFTSGLWKRDCSKMRCVEPHKWCFACPLISTFQTWVAVFGLVAAVASFRTGWKATALPRVSPPAKKEEVAETAENVVAYDVTS